MNDRHWHCYLAAYESVYTANVTAASPEQAAELAAAETRLAGDWTVIPGEAATVTVTEVHTFTARPPGCGQLTPEVDAAIRERLSGTGLTPGQADAWLTLDQMPASCSRGFMIAGNPVKLRCDLPPHGDTAHHDPDHHLTWRECGRSH